MPSSKTKLVVTTVSAFVLLAIAGIAIGRAANWFRLNQAETDQESLTEAYAALIPPPFAHSITDRHYERQVIFTDSVERFRFQNADRELVDELLVRLQLQPSSVLLSSKFEAPDWWLLPTDAEYFSCGAGHQYALLVYQPAQECVYLERTQD